MSDYDNALELDPNNFLAHYNRGLMRVQLGDDNRAITDFDFIIKMEPQNFMAIFNRALLHDKTGNLRAAIRIILRLSASSLTSGPVCLTVPAVTDAGHDSKQRWMNSVSSRHR